MTGTAQSLYDLLGGEPVLRAVIEDFVERAFADVMIGFFFRDANKARIKEMEFQLAAEFLGGPQRYRGRPLAEAHRKHRIMGGQFARRSQILREVLAAHGVVPEVTAAWLSHVESQRGEVTTDPHGQCND